MEVAKGKNKGATSKDLSFEEVQVLLKAVDDEGDEMFAWFVRFCLYTGCRRNEIRLLRFEDLNLADWTMRIHAQKTGKEMIIPINKALRRVIEGMDLKEEGYIFRSNSGGHRSKFKDQPFSESWATHRFKYFVRECGLSEVYRLHSLRHTYSTFLREQGIPLDIVSKLLGHSSPRITAENYDHSIAIHFRDQADLVDFEKKKRKKRKKPDSGQK